MAVALTKDCLMFLRRIRPCLNLYAEPKLSFIRNHEIPGEWFQSSAERLAQRVADGQMPSIAALLFLDRWGAPDRHLGDALHDITRLDSVHDEFLKPAVSYRPRLRYWIPDAHVDLDQVYDDIAQAGARGAAGVEVLGFYLYGASPGTYVPTDWNTYGWGTPAWSMFLKNLLSLVHWCAGC